MPVIRFMSDSKRRGDGASIDIASMSWPSCWAIAAAASDQQIAVMPKRVRSNADFSLPSSEPGVFTRAAVRGAKRRASTDAGRREEPAAADPRNFEGTGARARPTIRTERPRRTAATRGPKRRRRRRKPSEPPARPKARRERDGPGRSGRTARDPRRAPPRGRPGEKPSPGPRRGRTRPGSAGRRPEPVRRRGFRRSRRRRRATSRTVATTSRHRHSGRFSSSAPRRTAPRVSFCSARSSSAVSASRCLRNATISQISFSLCVGWNAGIPVMRMPLATIQ